MIVGTAAHIDHGKTSLIRRLTGRHTDRLPEEIKRGISIELGYAYVPLEGGEVLGFIDVPGHEKAAYLRHLVPRKIAVDLAYERRRTLLKDLGLILEVALLPPSSTAYDLSGVKSVALHITTPSNTVLSRYMTIYSTTGGVVRYSWSSTDWTSGVEVGQNLMEYEVLTTSTRLTFPNCSYDILGVITDFAQAATT